MNGTYKWGNYLNIDFWVPREERKPERAVPQDPYVEMFNKFMQY